MEDDLAERRWIWQKHKKMINMAMEINSKFWEEQNKAFTESYQ